MEAGNPLEWGPDLEVEPAEWRLVTLRWDTPDGGSLEADTLRPSEWVKAHGGVGGRASVENSDIATLGQAAITAVTACPDIHAGPGRLVTSVYRHSPKPVLALRVEGESKPITVTGNHPFWSEDRRDFVRADSLRPGERLQNAAGESVAVLSARPRGPPQRVYNLEVDAEHAYRVGTGGLLVHNACATRLKNSLESAGYYGDPGTAVHHVVSRNAAAARQARDILRRHGIGLDEHWNGAYLPGKGSSARGAYHPKLHTAAYYQSVNDLLAAADATGSTAAVINALQKIRRQLADGISVPQP